MRFECPTYNLEWRLRVSHCRYYLHIARRGALALFAQVVLHCLAAPGLPLWTSISLDLRHSVRSAMRVLVGHPGAS